MPDRNARSRRRWREPDDDDLVGPRRMDAERARARDDEDDDGEDEGPARRSRLPAPRLRRRRGGGDGEGALELAKTIVRDLPAFAKLLGRLAFDSRVSPLDKALVAGALAYMVAPVDLIPDIPVLGQIEDVYLLALALRRLLNNAGVDVLLDHWEGDTASLEAALTFLDRAGGLLPERLRMLLGGPSPR